MLFKNNEHQPILKVQITKEKEYIDPLTGKLTYIDEETNIQKEYPTILTTDTKKELEKMILKRNKNHFAQAKNTPLHQEQLNKIWRNNDLNLYDI